MLRPNRSASPRSTAFVYGSLCTVSATIAGGFTAAGYWPVLPFAGLELLALGIALAWVSRQGERCERICVAGDWVDVGQRDAAGQRQTKLLRYWTQVRLERGTGRERSRLALVSHGRPVEIGGFLTDGERLELTRALRSWVGPDATRHGFH